MVIGMDFQMGEVTIDPLDFTYFPRESFQFMAFTSLPDAISVPSFQGNTTMEAQEFGLGSRS